MDRILIVKPSSLGDVVHALPALGHLRAAFPHARIDWVVKQQWAALLARAKGLDRVWSIPAGLTGWLSVAPALRAVRYEVVVDLQGLLRSAALAWFTGAPRRVGFADAREGSPWFYTERIAVPTRDMHAVDRYLLAVRALAPVRAEGPIGFGMEHRPEDGPAIGRLLQAHGVESGEAWIAVNPSARWPTKQWPAEAFAEAADRIQDAGWGRIVFIGGADDREVTRKVRAAMKSRSVDLAGEVPLVMLPALLKTAGLLLTNDSGPMHVAAAVGTPVVAVFGPTSPVRTGPYGSGHTVLQQKLSCSPCFSRRCANPVALECLRAVTPDQVVEAVRLALERRPAVDARRSTVGPDRVLSLDPRPANPSRL